MAKTTEEAKRARPSRRRAPATQQQQLPAAEEPTVEDPPAPAAPTTTKVLLAHIVRPSSKMEDLQAGKVSRVKALCGKYVTRPALPPEDVCRQCFNLYEPLPPS